MVNRLTFTQPDKKASSDFVARFRSGMVASGRPVALQKFRVTTGDKDIADKIADLFGGEPQEWETKTTEFLEVMTDVSEVDIILDGVEAVSAKMTLWGRNAKVRECDGNVQSDGTACQCPSSMSDRQAAGRQGTACNPDIFIAFTLADAPDLGRFKFVTGSWQMAKEIGAVQDALQRVGGAARATLSLQQVEYVTKSGEQRRYTKPVLKIIGAVE